MRNFEKKITIDSNHALQLKGIRKFAPSCPGGEIGRRTILRGWRAISVSSNLILGTMKMLSATAEGIFYFDARKSLLLKGPEK